MKISNFLPVLSYPDSVFNLHPDWWKTRVNTLSWWFIVYSKQDVLKFPEYSERGSCDASEINILVKITKQKSTFSILNNLYAILNLSRLMTNVTIHRANNRSFPISSQLHRSEVPTLYPREVPTFPPPPHKGRNFVAKSPLSPRIPSHQPGVPPPRGSRWQVQFRRRPSAVPNEIAI